MSRKVALGLCAGWLAWSSVALADTTPFVLDYRVGPDCPTLPAFLAQVSKRSPNAVYAPANAAARAIGIWAETHHGQTTGEVVVNAWEAPRRVTGKTCAGVMEGLAFIVAVSLDPYLMSARPGPPAPPRLDLVSRPSAPPKIDHSHDREARVGALARLIGGPAPNPMVGGAIASELFLWGRTASWLRMSIEYATTGTFDVGSGAARFRLISMGVQGCAPGLHGRVGMLTGCLGANAGMLSAMGFAVGEVTTGHSVVRPWLDGELAGHGSWFVAGPISLDLDAAVGLAATHRAFVFEPPREVIHDPSPLVWRVGAGLGASIW